VKWYQIHLSTLLAVTLLASPLAWLNVCEQDISVRPITRRYESTPAHIRGRGWPMAFETWYDDPRSLYRQWNWGALTENVVFCLLLLALAGAAIERLTRRRERGRA
jgi:hypothetical protein